MNRQSSFLTDLWIRAAEGGDTLQLISRQSTLSATGCQTPLAPLLHSCWTTPLTHLKVSLIRLDVISGGDVNFATSWSVLIRKKSLCLHQLFSVVWKKKVLKRSLFWCNKRGNQNHTAPVTYTLGLAKKTAIIHDTSFFRWKPQRIWLWPQQTGKIFATHYKAPKLPQEVDSVLR